MLKIVITPKILGPPQSVALGVKFFSLMVNPRLHSGTTLQQEYDISTVTNEKLPRGCRSYQSHRVLVVKTIMYTSIRTR